MADKQKLIRITYNPQFSASVSKTVLLREQQNVMVGNAVRTEYVPTIKGLPTEFTIEKGEIKEVTLEQFKQLFHQEEIDFPTYQMHLQQP